MPHLKDALLVAALAIAASAPALHGTEYAFDDKEIVQNNPRLVVTSRAEAWTLVSSPYWSDRYAYEQIWRPTTVASLALDRALLGPEPDLYRRSGVAWHAATCVALLLLMRRLVPGRRATLAAALLFAAQPVHGEVTGSIVGRGEVLALLFTLLAMHAHLSARRAARAAARGEPTWSRARRALGHLGATALFALAAGSKEVALTGPFIAVALEVAGAGGWPPVAGGRARRVVAGALRRGWPYLLYAGMLAAYLVARALVLGDLLPDDRAARTEHLPASVRLLVAAEVGRDALRVVLLPQPTSAHYPFVEPSWSQARPIVAGLMHLALLGLALAQLRARGERGPARRTLGLGLLGFYLALGPVSNLVPIGVVRADRVLYTPSAFLDLALAAAIVLAPRPDGLSTRVARALSTGALAAALTLYALQLRDNARAWTSDDRLWQTTADRFPDDPRAQGAYGQLLVHRGQVEDALPRLHHAVLLCPAESKEVTPTGHLLAARLRADLGDALARLRRHGEARRWLAEALALDPSDESAHLGLVRLGVVEALAATDPTARDLALHEAARASADGVRALPGSYDLWCLRGQILGERGLVTDALMAFDRAVERRPEPWDALLLRARLRRHGLDDVVGALKDYRGATDLLLSLPPTVVAPEDRARGLREAMVARVELSRRLGGRDEAAEGWLAAGGLLDEVNRRQ